MSSRLSYDESIRRLQQIGYLGANEFPPMPDHRPQFDDEEPLGFSFFRSMAADGDLSGLTLQRTYFAKSEISRISFDNTDLSESTMCWNDFLSVNFSRASLADCDMRASLFENCRFDDADLSGSDLRRSSFEGCTFYGAVLDRVILASSQRNEIALTDAQQSVVDWHNDDGDEPPGG